MKIIEIFCIMQRRNLEMNRYLVEKLEWILRQEMVNVTPYQIAYERKDEKLLLTIKNEQVHLMRDVS